MIKELSPDSSEESSFAYLYHICMHGRGLPTISNAKVSIDYGSILTQPDIRCTKSPETLAIAAFVRSSAGA